MEALAFVAVCLLLGYTAAAPVVQPETLRSPNAIVSFTSVIHALVTVNNNSQLSASSEILRDYKNICLLILWGVFEMISTRQRCRSGSNPLGTKAFFEAYPAFNGCGKIEDTSMRRC